jgi:hypothetical protein
MSAWNDFVKKIYHEGHNKNPNYSFKQALQDASKRKSEMGASTTKTSKVSKKSSRSKKSKRSKKSNKNKRTRRR